MTSGRTVVVVAAHSDDEALGCGGTIARHAAEGDTVHAVFMADGISSRPGSSCKELNDRLESAQRAHEILGIQRVKHLGLADNRMDSIPLLDVVKALEQALLALEPEIIYTHHYGDLNVDHRITHEAVMTACRPIPKTMVREIYSFEVLSSTEWATPQRNPFSPNTYVDISAFLGTKLDALRAYDAEMRDQPHSRSMDHIKHLAHHRGHSMGTHAAEAFMALRIIR